MCVLRIYWATEPQYDIKLKDISQWKSITQTINMAEAFHCSEVLVLFKIIHKMAQLPANSLLLHLSLTDHFAWDRAMIDCVYVLSPLCDWWSKRCVYYSGDECHVYSVHAVVLCCTHNRLCRWCCVKPELFQLSVQLNHKKKNKALFSLYLKQLRFSWFTH